jgi:hypothetical protein
MTIDDSRLRTLYAKSAIAKALLDHFAERQNSASETTVDTMEGTLTRAGVQASRGAIVGVFRDLEAAGAGEFIVGRKKHPSRFHWTGESVAVGKRARSKLSISSDHSPPVQVRSVSSDVPRGLVQHLFLLRVGMTVSFALPADLTPVEAARLADFIKTLPFER